MEQRSSGLECELRVLCFWIDFHQAHAQIVSKSDEAAELDEMFKSFKPNRLGFC